MDNDQQPLPSELQPIDDEPHVDVYVCKVCLTRQAAPVIRRTAGDWVIIWCDVCQKERTAGPALILTQSQREKAIRGELWRARMWLNRMNAARPNPNPAQRVSLRNAEEYVARLEERLKEIE